MTKKILVYGLSNDWGGVEAIVMSMVERMGGTFEFIIIHSKEDSSYEERFQSEHIHFVHLPTWGSDIREFASSLKILLQAGHYNYVWINGCIMANRTIISAVRRYSKAKIITHSHGSSFEEANKLKRMVLLSLHRINKSYYLRNIDYPCMCSVKSGKWFYGDDYMQTHKVHYVKNGVNIEKYRFSNEVREEYRTDLGIADKFVLFHAGRLTLVKNQSKLLRMLAGVISHGIDAILLIAGDGELREELERYAKELDIDKKVRFLGKRDDVDKLYQAADVMLLPSFHEGFPVTLVEAQASGLPCLVSDKVSNETDITGLVRFLSIDDDNNSWVEAIKDIKSSVSDRLKAFDVVWKAGYNIDQVCEEFINFISQ